jgi:dCMP deaminase
MNTNWLDYYFKLIPVIAAKSKDPSSKVGCIIVNEDHSIVATGYNGFPRGVNDDKDRYENREQKLYLIEHSERNCLYYCAKNGVPLKGTILLLEWAPCHDCMRGIIQSGIKKIYINGDSAQFNNRELFNRWQPSLKWSIIMAKEADVLIYVYSNSHLFNILSITDIENLL